MLVMKHLRRGNPYIQVAQTNVGTDLHRVILTAKKKSSSYMETSEMRQVSKYLYSTDL